MGNKNTAHKPCLGPKQCGNFEGCTGEESGLWNGGYYVHTSSTVYVCWKDVRVVTLISSPLHILAIAKELCQEEPQKGKLLYRYLFQLLDTIRQLGSQ